MRMNPPKSFVSLLDYRSFAQPSSIRNIPTLTLLFLPFEIEIVAAFAFTARKKIIWTDLLER